MIRLEAAGRYLASAVLLLVLAGTGTAAGNNAPFYVANNPTDLVNAFDVIILPSNSPNSIKNGSTSSSTKPNNSSATSSPSRRGSCRRRASRSASTCR